MKDLIPTIDKWIEENKNFVMATVIQTWGSSPRPAGSTMIVSEEMDMAGSVSGGCVEGAVIQTAGRLIENGTGERLSYGVSDEEAWSVGLSCGGKMQVYAERFLAHDDRPEEQAAWEQLHTCLVNNQPCILVTHLVDGKSHHTLVHPDGMLVGQLISDDLKEEALRAYRERKTQVVGGGAYFAQVFPRKSQLLIIGAAHIAADLVTLASLYDFETIVIDPRGVYASKTVFKTAPDQIIEAYPSEVLADFELDAYAYAVILSHDPKIDDNALHVLLRSDVGYIGALGSRKTHAKRVARLQAAGFTEEEIGRIHAPVGLDINAKLPAEIALSVMAELVSVKNAYK